MLLMIFMTAITIVILRRQYMFAYNERGRRKGDRLTFSRLMTYIYIYIYIYMLYRTANLQMLHFIYLFNKYTY